MKGSLKLLQDKDQTKVRPEVYRSGTTSVWV